MIASEGSGVQGLHTKYLNERMAHIPQFIRIELMTQSTHIGIQRQYQKGFSNLIFLYQIYLIFPHAT